MSRKEWKEWLPLANDAGSIHTPNVSLKNAALLALIGIILLTVLVVQVSFQPYRGLCVI
jgi:hypothetical protein